VLNREWNRPKRHLRAAQDVPIKEKRINANTDHRDAEKAMHDVTRSE
jgi:hypothetical protein